MGTSTWHAADGRTGRIPTFDEIEARKIAGKGGGGKGAGGNWPSTMDIESLILSREEARLSKDWGLADTLRDQLRSNGVEVYDKSQHWTSTDGRSGRVPTFTDVEAFKQARRAGYAGNRATPYPAVAASPAANGYAPWGGAWDTWDIEELVAMREQARLEKDWGKADA